MAHRPTGSLVKVEHFGRERAGIILEWEFATIFAGSIEEVEAILSLTDQLIGRTRYVLNVRQLAPITIDDILCSATAEISHPLINNPRVR